MPWVMTEQPNNPLTSSGHGAAKGLALGLGLLLIGGTALLITLLILREPELGEAEMPSLQLQAGEKVVDASLDEGRALFVVEDEEGSQRVILMDLATGERNELGMFPY